MHGLNDEFDKMSIRMIGACLFEPAPEKQESDLS